MAAQPTACDCHEFHAVSCKCIRILRFALLLRANLHHSCCWIYHDEDFRSPRSEGALGGGIDYCSLKAVTFGIRVSGTLKLAGRTKSDNSEDGSSTPFNLDSSKSCASTTFSLRASAISWGVPGGDFFYRASFCHGFISQFCLKHSKMIRSRLFSFLHQETGSDIASLERRKE
jgi:hypothetical protein